MALIPCRECHKQISDFATACPYCGRKTVFAEKTAQIKKYGIFLLINGIAMIVGMILFFTAIDVIDQRGYHKTVDTGSIIQLAIGIGLFLSGLIYSVITFRKLSIMKNENSPAPAVPIPSTRRQDGVDILPIQVRIKIPQGKGVLGSCELCDKQSIVATCKIPDVNTSCNLCESCINEYMAQIQ